MPSNMQLIKHWAATLDDYTIDLAWSPDGSQLAVASAAGPVTIFNPTDGAIQHPLAGHDEGTNCLAWHPAGSALATGGQDGLVKFWDPAAGQHVTSVKMGNAWVEHLAWRPVGSQLADAQSGAPHQSTWLAAAAGRQLLALRPDGTELHAFKDAPKSISAVSWHPQGGCVAVSYFGGVCLWDGDDFIPQKEFPYNNGIQVTRCPMAGIRQSGPERASVGANRGRRTANERLRN
jgi:WD40 repeat protein